MWEKNCERDNRISESLSNPVHPVNPVKIREGSVTLCSDLPGLDPTVTQKIHFEMKMYPGYQHLYTVVYDEDGEYVATVYPAQGLRETTWIETSCAGGRLRGVAETVQQPTLEVDIEVEGNLVPPAVAGHFTFPQPEGCAGARKYYTCAVDNPDPEPDTPTELIAVTAVPHEGLSFEGWAGNCAHFDQNGNYLGMLPASLPENPDDRILDETIYVKCVRAEEIQMASAMTNMAILEGVGVPLEPVGLIPCGIVMRAFLKPGAAIVIKGVRAEVPVAGAVSTALDELGYTTSPEIYLEPRKEDVLDYVRDNKASIFYFDGHGGTVDNGQTLGIVPYSPNAPTAREYWLTPDDVAPINQYAYKLAMFSTCGQAKIDLGQPWKDAFEAEAVIGWDEKTWPDVKRAYDLAFFECFNPSDPAKYRKNVQGAHDYATTIAQTQPKWKQPWEKEDKDGNVIEIVPVLGEPRCIGDAIIIPAWKRRFDLE